MELRFFVDVYSSAGVKLGTGPLISARSWSNIARMDKAGEFSTVCSAADPNAVYIAKKGILKCYTIESSGPVYIGAGIVDKIEVQLETDGSVSLNISGDNLLRELTYRSVKFLSLSSGAAAISHAAAVTAIAAFAPAGWTFTADGSPPNANIYYRFAGELVLAAAVQVAVTGGTHFYMSADRTITFISDFTDSGIRAIETPFSPDVSETTTAYIEKVTILDDTYDLITRIYPYGEGEGSTALALTNTTRSAPAGYTLSVGSNYIKKDSAESTYGIIERVVQYKDIKELGVTLSDQQAAANTLFDTAIAELGDKSSPARFYDLTLAYCPTVLHPTQTIRAILRRVFDGATLVSYDEVLNIIEVRTEITQERALRTTGLTVSTVQRWPDKDTNPIVELIKVAQLR
jgi:hypothetical protein